MLTEYRIWNLFSNEFVGEVINNEDEARKRAYFLSEGKGEDGGIRIMTREVTPWEAYSSKKYRVWDNTFSTWMTDDLSLEEAGRFCDNSFNVMAVIMVNNGSGWKLA